MKQADKKFLEIQPGDVESTFADCSKLEKYIDFKPNTKLSDGINKYELDTTKITVFVMIFNA